MKYFSMIAVFLAAFLFASCKSEDEILDPTKSHHVLPFNLKIADDGDLSTRVYFQGAAESSSNMYRMIFWSEGDEMTIHSDAFDGTKKGYNYKIHITEKDGYGNATAAVLYGDDDLPWWSNATKPVRFYFPAKKYNGAVSAERPNDLYVEIAHEQSGIVNMAHSVKDKVYCPENQEGAYNSYNVIDYDYLIMYAGASVTTDADKKPQSATIKFYPCVKALDVILDAPSEAGSRMNVKSVQVEIGTGKQSGFGGRCTLTGTIKPRSPGDALSSGQVIDNTNPTYDFVKLNVGSDGQFISGNDRIVARLMIPREVGNNSGGNIRGGVAKVTIVLANSLGVEKTYVKYIDISTTNSNNQSITHFYLGPVPTFNNTGGWFEAVQLTGTDDNPLKPVFNDAMSLTTTHKLSFNLSTATEVVEIGMINFKTTDPAYSSHGSKTINGQSYSMYTHTLTETEKTNKKVSLEIQPTATGTGEILLQGDGFVDYLYTTKIGKGVFSVDIFKDTAHNNRTAWTSEHPVVTNDGDPIINQSAKVTVYIADETFEYSNIDYITIGGKVASENIGADKIAGYRAYTTNDAFVISSSCETVSYTVTAHLLDHTTKNCEDEAEVDVHDISIGETYLTSKDDYKKSMVYLLKSPNDSYLTSNGSTLSGTTSTPGVEGYWKFGGNGGGSSKIVTATNENYFLKQNNASAPQLGTSGTASIWNVDDDPQGLIFSYTYKGSGIGATTRTYYPTLNGSTVNITYSTKQIWKVYPVTFPAPTAP